ncbi:MAG: signal peptidase I [Actinobacteria bacterium HGW-Actinobacteria-10]|nr:MAG: signal peptidase I [Actinobacteria bacterium HGW-Actinobacteria-10]
MHDAEPQGESASPEPDPLLRVARWLFETALVTLLAFLAAMGIRASIAEAVYVPSGSMESTIMTWDRALVEKITYRFRDPVPGEIVTLDDPSGRYEMLIKRVIAVGGQTVDIRDGIVLVDGMALVEPYTRGLPTYPDTLEMPVRIPEGHVWLMGDNRTDSTDSRGFGPQPVSAVNARALAVYWPLEHVGRLAGH